jgi:hypothetical protein
MLYWGPNVNHMYCLLFCFKALEPPSWLQLPKCSSFKIGLDSLTFSHTCESLFESFSNLLQLSYFYFYCKPKDKVITLEIDFHSFLKFLLIFFYKLGWFSNFFWNVCFSYFIHEHFNYFIFTYFIFIFRKLCHIQYS